MKEKLRKQLLAEQSRRNIDLVVSWCGTDAEKIQQLVTLSLSNENGIASRAAWALEKLASNQPGSLDNWIPQIITHLTAINSSSTRRTIAKILMLHSIPEEFEGEVLDFCLSMIESPTEPVAVKANCMTTVFNLLPKYPDLQQEIFSIIENQIDKNSVAFEARYLLLKMKFKIPGNR